MTKKSFALPKNLAADLNSTFTVVENHLGSLNYRVVPIEAIEFDPDNPRELHITKADVTKGVDTTDPQFEIKTAELEKLQEMAKTIEKYGVRNAVEIYRDGAIYRLIHGERRCLSSMLAGKTEIPAKVLDKKPNGFDIKLLQLIENVQREDLTLYEMIKNVKSVLEEYKKHIDPAAEINAALIEKLINKSRTQCFNIVAVLTAPAEIQTHIENGKIKNLEKAAIVAKEKDAKRREELLLACLNGASVKELQTSKQKIEQKAIISQPISINRKPGKKPLTIHLGATKNPGVIAKLIRLVTEDPNYKHRIENFKTTALTDYQTCASIFKQLIKLMEKVETV